MGSSGAPGQRPHLHHHPGAAQPLRAPAGLALAPVARQDSRPDRVCDGPLGDDTHAPGARLLEQAVPRPLVDQVEGALQRVEQAGLYRRLGGLVLLAVAHQPGLARALGLQGDLDHLLGLRPVDAVSVHLEQIDVVGAQSNQAPVDRHAGGIGRPERADAVRGRYARPWSRERTPGGGARPCGRAAPRCCRSTRPCPGS